MVKKTRSLSFMFKKQRTTKMTDKAYEIKTGESLQITFTTAGEHEGHKWHPTQVAENLTAKNLSTKSDPLLRGKKITTEFSIKADTPGEYDITFGLVPAWKLSDAPKQTQTLKIIVR